MVGVLACYFISAGCAARSNSLLHGPATGSESCCQSLTGTRITPLFGVSHWGFTKENVDFNISLCATWKQRHIWNCSHFVFTISAQSLHYFNVVKSKWGEAVPGVEPCTSCTRSHAAPPCFYLCSEAYSWGGGLQLGGSSLAERCYLWTHLSAALMNTVSSLAVRQRAVRCFTASDSELCSQFSWKHLLRWAAELNSLRSVDLRKCNWGLTSCVFIISWQLLHKHYSCSRSTASNRLHQLFNIFKF